MRCSHQPHRFHEPSSEAGNGSQDLDAVVIVTLILRHRDAHPIVWSVSEATAEDGTVASKLHMFSRSVIHGALGDTGLVIPVQHPSLR